MTFIFIFFEKKSFDSESGLGSMAPLDRPLLQINIL